MERAAEACSPVHIKRSGNTAADLNKDVMKQYRGQLHEVNRGSVLLRVKNKTLLLCQMQLWHRKELTVLLIDV